jgi:NAD(P)H dehydrogenase (quinone)
MSKSILVILGHPNPDSFCAALAQAYSEGAQAKGLPCQVLKLSELNFEPVLKRGFQADQALEPDLQAAQAAIQSAQHLVWVYPNWWGGLPALLKGFIDRVFLPGFAFKYQQGPIPAKLLKGRSARLMITLDTPVWLYRFGMGAPGVKVMQSAVLAFSGVTPTKTTLMGPQRGASQEKRQKWLEQAFELGKRGA